MSIRIRRWFGWVLPFLGGVAALITAVSAFFARYLIAPPRQRQWCVPADLGLDYEEVEFPARDGVRLSGWFIPAAAQAARGGATIALIHGWGWNRLGAAAEGAQAALLGARPVALLRLARALHSAGYHVLTFDLRNHGLSAAARPVAFGQAEAQDLLGALAYLDGRADVDSQRIGAIGFSMGANTVLYALPQTDLIKSAVAVQPGSGDVFAARFMGMRLGPLSRLVLPLTEMIYRLAGGPRFGALQPGFAAAGAGAAPVLYVQGRGDPWGSLADVARMAAVTPNAVDPLYVEASHRYAGYQYVTDHPQALCAFLERHL